VTKYLLDTNVFIEAKNRYYGFDFCPAFWNWLVLLGEKDRLASVKHVKDEIAKGEDELSHWIKN